MTVSIAQKGIWILVSLAAAVAIGALISLQDVTISLYTGIVLVFFALAFLLSAFFQQPKIVMRIVLFGLTVRVLMMLVLKLYSYSTGLDGFFPGDVDAYAYHGDALAAIQSNSWLQALEGNLSYTVFVAFLYSLFGPDMNVPQLINAGASLLLIPLLYELGNRAGGRRAGVAAAFLWSVFPSATFWSVSLLKDGFVVLGMILAAFFILGLNRNNIRVHEALLGLSGVIMIGFLRPQFLLAVALPVVFIVVRQLIKGRHHFLRNTLILVICAGFAAATTAGDIISEALTDSTSAEEVESTDEIALEGGSGIPLVTMFPPEVRWIVQFPFSVFAPFPWQWFSVSQGLYILSGAEMMVWYALYFSMWRRRRELLAGSDSKILLLYALAIFLAVSFSLPNIGSIYRYRLAALAVLLPLVLHKPFRKREGAG